MKQLIGSKALKLCLGLRQPCHSKPCLVKNYWVPRYAQQPAGYTLIEVIVVILIIGTLAGIASPGWVAFNNRQHVNKANDSVLGAIRQAQGESKAKKRSYSVSFRVSNSIPQIAVYSDGATVSDNQWQPLGGDLGLKAGQVSVSTNLGDPNQGGTVNALTDVKKTITFDYTGNLPVNAKPPIKVVVAVPQSAVKRCVILETLLGGIRTGKDNECT